MRNYQLGWFTQDLRHQAATIDAMTDSLRLRDPDARGVRIDQHAALGHRRLSIIDPERGVQPMHSSQRDAGKVPRAGISYAVELDVREKRSR